METGKSLSRFRKVEPGQKSAGLQTQSSLVTWDEAGNSQEVSIGFQLVIAQSIPSLIFEVMAFNA